VTVCPANAHDKTQVPDVLDSIVIPRPEGEQHICLDKGYDYPDTRDEIETRGYMVHIPARGLDTPVPEHGDPNRHPARRWVVEVCHAWLHKFRKILVRYERLAENYLGLLQFACCLIIYRKLLV
jgi:transposase